MTRSKYPALHRLVTELQETLDVKPVDGFIGAITEKALARALTRYDGNDVIGFLSDYQHHKVEYDKELDIPIIPTNGIASKVPAWYSVARSYIGLEEIVGDQHNPEIIKFWEYCHLPFKTDETPWCAGFVGGCLEQCGIKSTRSGMARSYLKWGKRCEEINIGAIAVFWRGSKNSSSGHVGFVAGKTQGGFIPILGGNQGNKVCIKSYPASRALDFRWVA